MASKKKTDKQQWVAIVLLSVGLSVIANAIYDHIKTTVQNNKSTTP